MYSGRITNCYDSHSHLLATGEMQLRLNLRGLRSPVDVNQLQVMPQNKKGGWLFGFGYDETDWEQKPHRKFLDLVFPEVPVVFSRVDGHVYWVNSLVLKKLGWLTGEGKVGTLPQTAGGEIVVDDDGVPTGLIIDAAKTHLDTLIPKDSETETQSYLMAGIKTFHENGFTHIRDMSCSEMQWNELLKLEASGLLTMAIEQTFSAETANQFDAAYDLATRAIKIPLKKVKAQSLKIYYDGALGSEGAYLSQPYKTSPDNTGLKLLTKDQLEAFIRLAWEIPMDIAVHTIGDQAVHEVSEVAVKVWDSGVKGRLHLEHAELMRPESVELLKGRDVVCHLQPCHWLTDKQWLSEKLGDLLKFAFPWALLQRSDIPFYFGSDSPISRPNIVDNQKAIEQSPGSGIPPLKGEWDIYHSHPDHQWISNCYTIFENGHVKEVVFDGVSVK